MTGGYAGIGHEVCNILYKNNATVYIAGRSADKAKKSIDSIRAANPYSEGEIAFLKIDLSDLSTIKSSVNEFLTKESQLHILINNAGIVDPPPGMISPQGIDIRFATNILGPFLLTKLLHPILHSTTKVSEEGDVRVSWAGSMGLEMMTPKGGMDFEQDGSLKNTSATGYGVTKAANYFLGHLFPRHYQSDGILYSVGVLLSSQAIELILQWQSFNPGLCITQTFQDAYKKYPSFLLKIVEWILMHPPIFGAYTELYTTFSHELTLEEDQSVYIVPWGRKFVPRKDLVQEVEKTDKDGKAEKLWAWCERETVKYV